jgi:tRNA (cytidine/uridine-2'-O-)-methyltransferase
MLMALSVALIEPEIPPNTGNIARLCAATGTSLHLIEPLGFEMDDARLERAGLHYMGDVDLWVHPYWRFFRSAISRDRCLYFSAHGTRPYVEAPFNPNSVLVFGNEGSGLPKPIIAKYPDRVFRIPMRSTVRNLNLATSVGIVVYEAIRQLGVELHDRSQDMSAEGRDREGASRQTE